MCTGIRLLLLIHSIISSFFFLSNYQTLNFITFFSGTVRSRRLKLGTHVDSGQMYHVYRNLAAAYLSLCFFIFLFLQFSNIKIFRHTVLMSCEALKIETRHTHGQWADVSCIPESGCCCLLVPLFLHFLSVQFSNIEIFRTLLSGIVRPRRLKLGSHVDSGWMYGVYQNQASAAYSSLYFFFLQDSNNKIFVTLFSGTVRPRRLKLGAHMDNEWMYRVYQNQAAAAYLLLYFFIFLSLQFSNIKMFLSHLSQELWGTRLKLYTHVDSGWMNRVYRKFS